MTSGLISTVPYSFIWVDRAKRLRVDITDAEIDELAESIARVGLINFPVIRKSGEIVAGERRWLACGKLKWPEIQVHFMEDLSEKEYRKVEIEENVRRKDVTWKDQCRFVDEYHLMMKDETKTWTQAQTAQELGFTAAHITNMLLVAAELSKANTRVSEAPKYSTALGITRRQNERRRADELAELIPQEQEPDAVPIIHTDFAGWLESYSGPKFNLVHCDFPYGINADKHDQGASSGYGGYADSADIFWGLCDTLRRATADVVDDSAHLIFWSAADVETLYLTKAALEKMGWRLDGRLLLWTKSDGTSILPDPNRGPRWGYEVAFFGSRGDRKIIQATTNWVSLPATKKYHMSEKPVDVLKHFMRMTCDEYTRALDPTAGSGNALIAAKQLGAGHILGLEREKEFFEGACRNWRENNPT